MTALLVAERKRGNAHPFIAAFIGGYYVFGKHDKINEQVSQWNSKLCVAHVLVKKCLSIIQCF